MEPIFHKIVTGSSAALIALSAWKISQATVATALIVNEKLNHLDEEVKRIANSIERGMNKYAPLPPPKR